MEGILLASIIVTVLNKNILFLAVNAAINGSLHADTEWITPLLKTNHAEKITPLLRKNSVEQTTPQLYVVLDKQFVYWVSNTLLICV